MIDPSIDRYTGRMADQQVAGKIRPGRPGQFQFVVVGSDPAGWPVNLSCLFFSIPRSPSSVARIDSQMAMAFVFVSLSLEPSSSRSRHLTIPTFRPVPIPTVASCLLLRTHTYVCSPYRSCRQCADADRLPPSNVSLPRCHGEVDTQLLLLQMVPLGTRIGGGC